jgi:octaprenyl-diphosphate synthase
MQLMNVHDPSITESRYLQVVDRKTATLFQAAARIGAVLAGADSEVEARCAEYGARLGTAFQIIDDVLDYSGQVDQLGKQLGDDLREGKATLPLIHALGESTGTERDTVERAIRDGGGDFAAIAHIVNDHGSLQYARRRAEQEAALAFKAVEGLPASAFRQTLLDLSSFAVRRDR